MMDREYCVMMSRYEAWQNRQSAEILAVLSVPGLSRDRGPFAQCVIHMFDHQTHHRGQVHAMLSATGSPAPAGDLFALPE